MVTGVQTCALPICIDAPGLKGREALPIPKAVDVAPEPGAQAEAAKAAAGKKLSGEGGGGMRI